MRAPKLLIAASAVDLDFRYGCTPAWWQLWKGLYEEGADLVVTPYRGRAVESRWRRHLEALVERERPDAVIVFTIPMPHLRGIPTELRERFGIPVVFYDGDVPMSLPEYGGMDTGFNWYHDADPSEYDLLVSNSEGGLERLLELGARRAEAVFWGADPDFFAP